MVGVHNFVVDKIKKKELEPKYILCLQYYNTTRVDDGERRANAARNTQQ